MTKKTYNFGEKSKEKVKQQDGSFKDLDVWQSPKYLKSKEKAIELIENGNFDLDEGDFWILQNQGGGKMVYTGLIISHNGCLKINNKLEDALKFKPLSVSFVRDAGEKEKTMAYINQEQGVYEFGEISTKNCKNDYPYAMVLKRLMDRVILKNSKVGFFGIYSEAESDDFKDKPEPKEEVAKPKGNDRGFMKEKPSNNIADDQGMQELKGQKKEMSLADKKKRAEDFFAKTKIQLELCENLEQVQALEKENQAAIKGLDKPEYGSLYSTLLEAIDYVKLGFTGE